MKTNKLTKELILKAIEKSLSKKDLILNLGYNYNGGTRRTIRNKCKEYNIDLSLLNFNLTKEKYELNPKYCKFCGKKILYEQRNNIFCSHSCSAKYNNINRNKIIKEKISTSLQKFHNNSVKENLKRYCTYCNKELVDTHQKKFCSQKCARLYDHKQYISRWKNGEETGMKGEYSLSSHIKRYFLDKYNCKCQICGWGEENPHTNTIPLEIHHIDGDYTNNKEENLQLLCPNCHSLTETYKSHNKSGRKSREKYN